MLGWAVTFLIIAIIAGVLGFGGIAGTSAGIAQILFVIFLILFLVSLLRGAMPRRRCSIMPPTGAPLPLYAAPSPQASITMRTC